MKRPRLQEQTTDHWKKYYSVQTCTSYSYGGKTYKTIQGLIVRIATDMAMTIMSSTSSSGWNQIILSRLTNKAIRRLTRQYKASLK